MQSVLCVYFYDKIPMENLELQKISLDLQKAFLKLKNKKDVFYFLRDLLTEDEIREFCLRFDIAERLWK